MRFLVATDFSEASDKALMSAVNLATLTNSEIVLLHIFEVSEIDKSAKKIIGSGFLNREIKNRLEQMVSEIEKNKSIKISYLTKEGELFDTMKNAVEETSSDILFIGTHGVHGVQHITGSFLAKTINMVDVPVWVVQKGSEICNFKNIYIYIDELFDNPVNPIIIDIAKKFNSSIHFNFTDSTSGFATKELISKIQSTLENSGINYTLSSLNGEDDMIKAFTQKATNTDSSLIILDRNQNEISTFIDVFNNKKCVEVLCLN
ncbi:MAG: universal stress protein [Bacteroidetes bacterium]|nr:universal stress protein [Bacteroidota bacterium]